ncbi:MAG TPA: histidine phosphatase family protein [Patescibacteria group bacterium]|nr:histidine phosphatase family protein [Patescibacteria group bacterium]
MHTKTLYLIRHGQVVGAGDERRYLGQHDVPLNDLGQRQAMAVGRWLCDRNISRLFCSDLSRTMATAAAVGRFLCLVAEPQSAWREINMGKWDGRTWKEVAALYPDELVRRNTDLVGFRPPGGESFDDCADRVWAALRDILELSEDNVAVVAHAGVNRLLLCQLLGIPRNNMFRLIQDYGCVNILRCGDWGCQAELINYCPEWEENGNEPMSPM